MCFLSIALKGTYLHELVDEHCFCGKEFKWVVTCMCNISKFKVKTCNLLMI